jgi:putative membrane protein
MYLLARWLIAALGLLAAAYLVPGIEVSGLYIALIVAVILGFINAIIRPILIILTLPINILTLGLFIFVINGILFWFVSTFVEGFAVDGLWTAVLGSLVLSVVSWIGNELLKSGRTAEY